MTTQLSNKMKMNKNDLINKSELWENIIITRYNTKTNDSITN
jgi:hypothetical protein